jgi:hypothetical protein
MSEGRLRQGLAPVVKKTVMERLKFPINNPRKKIVLLLVLFFSFLAQGDLSDLLLEIPDFNKLSVSEGRIKIHKGQGRTRDALTLVIGKQTVFFSCGISKECLPFNKTPDYQGKTAKVWWYKSKNNGLMGGENRLYQLEVNEKMVISFQDQTKHYLSARNFCLCINLVFFIISIMFVTTHPI